MRGIHEYAEDTKINVILSNLERYVSFSLGLLRVSDSFQFMPSSLSQLATNLEDCPHLKELFPQVWDVQGDLQLLTRKGVYPYDYVDSFQKFQETQLPPKEAFYSDFTGEDCSDKDYDHAQQVWTTFGCRSLQNYHNLYLLTDTLLLADVFENFRTICLETCKLNLAN